MSKKRAFVRYTKKGMIIPGSLIVTTQGGYPKNGFYKEVSVFANQPIGVCDEITGTLSTDLGMLDSTGSLDISISGTSVYHQDFPFSTSTLNPVSYSQIGKVALLTLITGATPTCPVMLFIYDTTGGGFVTIYSNLNVPYNTTFVYSWILEEGHDYLIAANQNAVCP